MENHRFEYEIWDKAGKLIADITNLVENRSFTLKLNGIDTCSFTMDFYRFNTYCKASNMEPRNVIWPLTVDIIVKLDGSYWKGFECIAATPNLGQNGATITVRGAGFLTLLTKRFVTATYTATEATAIPAALITATQAQTNGTLGITLGVQQYATGVLRDRTYERKNVREAIVELTNLVDGKFDFNFTYDKKFETYQMLGSLRGDLDFRYGDGGNIVRADIPTEGSTVSNKVTALGSGFGPDQLTSTQVDLPSQLQYGIREELPSFSSIITPTALDQNALGYVDTVKDMLQIPHIWVREEDLNLKLTSVGDRIPVNLSAFEYTSNVNGLYRLQQMVIDLDDQDASLIELVLDDQGVDQNEA